MMFKSTSILAVAYLISHVAGHMVITSPTPYGQSTLTNSPLENDGSDFPCKQRSGVYDISTMNHIAVGEPQTLTFKGGATHGGGSCQVSVTLDKEPTTKSEWKVIHSIVGGCPTNATGNIDDNADGTGAAVFHYEMPKGMPNGQYSLAWTWFNKIGNREMYMNCAPITVTGGADNNDVYNSLPDMFVINLPRESCSNTEGEDFVFPSPGPAAETPFSTALGSKTVGTGCASVMAKGRGAGAAGSAAGPTSAAATTAASSAAASMPAAASSQPTQASAGIGPVTVTTMATITGSNGSAPSSLATASSSMAPALSSAAPAQSASPSSGTGSNKGSGSTPSGGCSAGATPCTESVVCIGTTQFGLCNAGCAVAQNLAPGTTCSGGTIAKMRRVRRARRQAGPYQGAN